MLLSAAVLCAVAAIAAAKPHSMANIAALGGGSWSEEDPSTPPVGGDEVPSYSDETSESTGDDDGPGLVGDDSLLGGWFGGSRPMAEPDDSEALAQSPFSADQFMMEAADAGQEWVPVPVGIKWQNRAWCGLGGNCFTQSIPAGAKLVNVDLFDTSASKIKNLAQKYIVTCYYSAGTYEAWRPDAKKFTSAIKGMKMSDWDETWLDIRKLSQIKPIMEARIRLAKEKGCHGVEPDNVDCWQNKCVKDKSGGDKSMYQAQLVYNRWSATFAHSLGLNIGLKNNLNQVKDLVGDYDWAMNESCHAWNECSMVSPFVDAGKAVLATEYKGSRSKICAAARTLRFSQKIDSSGRWADC